MHTVTTVFNVRRISNLYSTYWYIYLISVVCLCNKCYIIMVVMDANKQPGKKLTNRNKIDNHFCVPVLIANNL